MHKHRMEHAKHGHTAPKAVVGAAMAAAPPAVEVEAKTDKMAGKAQPKISKSKDKSHKPLKH